ncbi:alcohol dehydrogenase catalytic domain-containing protein [Paraglaciecola sp. 20A4]|uniref:alcohol dehydrogenase catalytic domain-containing protein n=1 Tax=Paraglaciecola sp. 20A4 TaxID=2687288 RepID=UPI00140C2A45|nr:alcohol dehydrogenase catalytic domain-containing protein [Paraglaciecola sp. 20A4]
MKALVFNGPKNIQYENFDDPKITNNSNLILKVEKCSICGSDLHMYHGDVLGPKLDYSQPMAKFCTGHETIGEVVEIGSGVSTHKVGDRVLIAGGMGCGKCKRCLSGQLNICEQAASGKPALAYGISPGFNGGHAEYMEVLFADIGAAKIPDGVTDEQALLLTDALATGYYGVKMAHVKPGDSVAVIGQGPVGLMAAEAAMAVGASRVYCIDPDETRRNLSLHFGGIPLSPAEAIERIREDTNGLGIDAVIEAVGVGPTLKQAVRLLRWGGSLCVLGMLQKGTELQLQIMQAKSLNFHAGTSGVVSMWDELIPLVQAGRIQGKGVFTHEFSLAEGAEAFRLFDAREDGVIKTMITL